VLIAIAALPGGGGATAAGLMEAMIAFELAKMLLITTDGGAPTNCWSFLDPLRPALALLPLMAVATKAATAKQATMILKGVEKVMVERKISNSFGKDAMRTEKDIILHYEQHVWKHAHSN
jgi:hypothetical protein